MHEIMMFLGQHWLLTVLLVVAIIYLLIIESHSKVKGAVHLTPHKLVELINHEHAVVIDVREAAIYGEGHITGAINLPLSELQKSLKRLQKYKNKPLAVYGAANKQTQQGVSELRKMGFTRVYSLNGGLPAWRQASMPLVKG
jgi:rhodanese-related sulfurtransferase